MKTALEILKLELGYDKDGEIDIEQISRNSEFIEKAMKEYASQALDAAAEEAKVKFNTSMCIMSGKELKTDFGTYSVLKKSILKLKDQLK